MGSELSRIRPSDEIETNIGAASARAVGDWARTSTPHSDLFATNYLYHFESGRPLTDFSLGAWSQREFLILGPSFLLNFDAHLDAVMASIQFGTSPSPDSVRDLTSRGVQWFIVDKWNTDFVEWQNYWKVVYENERFLAVKL
jgi:hypothetical protein